jgi:hypothetical protein
VYQFNAEEGMKNDCDEAPLCDAPYGVMEQCLRRAFLEGPEAICLKPLPPECDGLTSCLPYLDWRR